MYENPFNLIDDLQKVAMKIKIQEVLNTLCKDERVHEVLNADVVLGYYEKMYEYFEKNPKDFLFPNCEWLRESLDRLDVDLSNVFDEYANVDHIKREEVIILFMLLWINMVIQNPIRIEVIKDPYDLFYIWTKNRVFIARPTETHYLQDGDRRVLDRLGKSYGWFTGVHHFSIGLEGAVEYHYSSPDDITNIDDAYNKAHGSVTKLRDMNDWAMRRLTKEQHELADADKRHWEPEDDTHKSSKVKLGWSKNDKPALIICKQKKRFEDRFNEIKKEFDGIENWEIKWSHDTNQSYLSIPYDAKKAIKDSDVIDVITKLNEDLLAGKEYCDIVRHRNTKFVVREMSGLSNKELFILLENYRADRYKKAIDPYIKDVVDILAKDYGIDVISDIISYAKRHARPKHNSPFKTVAIIDIINAMIKLKEKLNEEKN